MARHKKQTTRPAPAPATRAIGFLLLPQFSMMAFLSAVEPLRVANRFGGPLFSWRVLSTDGKPVTASNGMTMVADAPLQRLNDLAMLFVCSGFEPTHYASDALRATLRELAAYGVALGAIDTGSYLLADAGLLHGYKATMHWESISAFSETFQGTTVTDGLFEIDRDRYTCAGGTASMDLMLHLIAREHGDALAVAVSEQFLHERIRNPADDQRMSLYARLGTRNSGLLKAVGAMERHIEQPLAADELAAVAALSLRQLERLFTKHLHDTPMGYYTTLRLGRARQLLLQTDMTVLAVAMACGFGSVAHFSRAYRARFGCAPSLDKP